MRRVDRGGELWFATLCVCVRERERERERERGNNKKLASSRCYSDMILVANHLSKVNFFAIILAN